jgi:hypothetical protein
MQPKKYSVNLEPYRVCFSLSNTYSIALSTNLGQLLSYSWDVRGFLTRSIILASVMGAGIATAEAILAEAKKAETMENFILNYLMKL